MADVRREEDDDDDVEDVADVRREEDDDDDDELRLEEDEADEAVDPSLLEVDTRLRSLAFRSWNIC